MRYLSYRSVIFLLGAILFSLTAQAQSICTANAVNPVNIRAEGVTEQLADVSFTCSGTGAAGTISIQVFASPALSITSKLLRASTGETEATAIAGSQQLSVLGTVSGSTLTFSGLPVPAGNFTVLLTNIRVDATAIPVTPQNIALELFVSGTPGSVNPVALQFSSVATAWPSLRAGYSGSPAFPVCSTLSTGSGPAFAVTLAENVLTVFKTQGGLPNNTTLGYEFAANTETGFYVQATNGLGNVANSGTRFRILFSNVPTGAAVYVPVSLTGAPGTFQATLTASEVAYFTAVAPTTGNGLAPVSLFNGAGEAVYEVIADDPTALGGFSVPITVTGTAAQLASASITATAGLAPVGVSSIPGFSAATGTVTVTASASACTSGVITPAALPSATQGAPYLQWLAAGSAKTWSISSGSLPPGLSLNTSGLIGGVPTASGSYSFTVQVIDQSNTGYTKAYTLQVAGPVTISTASLPAGTFGAAYSQTLAATGGQGGYVWTANPGLLPPGLTLNPATGVISGTPTAAGTYPFSVTATDSSGIAVAQSFSISVTVPSAYCNQLTGLPTLVRAEALNDLLGTVTLGCSGSGGTIGLRIMLNGALPITSKVLNANTGLTEAVAQIGGNTYSGYIDSTGKILTFSGVVIPAGSSNVTIGNLRSDTSGLSAVNVPPAISVTAVVTGLPSLIQAAPVSYATGALAATSVSSVSNFASCSPVSATGGPAFTLKFSENFATAFKTRGDSTNTTLGSTSINTETGYYVSIGGVNNQANSATRIAVVFTGVPTGVTVYVPTTMNALTGQGAMVLIPTETGAFTPIVAIAPTAANTLPSSPALAPVVISGGTGVAVYEVTVQDPNIIENYSIPVYLVSGSTASAGTIKALVHIAPTGAGAANIPSFAVDGTLLTASQFTLCLSSSVLPQGVVGTPYPATTLMPSGGTAPYTFANVVLPAGLTMSTAGVITGTPTAATASGVTSNGSVIVQDSAGN